MSVICQIEPPLHSCRCVSPGTNFADTVFMYCVTDYSGAQAVRSYTRKDYTVLGTSVYPSAQGHSVTNWFIGCNVTNALTLRTGVKLPGDTGEVTLSVTVESGTPNPQLYVYNRVAQSNELLVTQGRLTFTRNLGDWRAAYCDTNGYAQAYLLCASGGVARVTHGYGTYPGQPYSLACSSVQQVVSVQVESIDVTSAKLGTSPNPPPFEGGTNWVFRVTNSPSPDKHAAVLYKDVVDGSFNVQDFDVTLTATLSPSGLTTHPLTFHWEKISGSGSGELLTPGSTSLAVYRNPGQGGVYRFRLTVRKGGRDLAFGEANLVLPLAGAEMDGVIQADLLKADAFVVRMKARYSRRQLKKTVNLIRWFWDNHAGDYTGRPDNANTPTVWVHNQVNDGSGFGAVCTWRSRPVRLTKPSNFILGYAMRQIGISRAKARRGTGLFTITETTDRASVGAGWDVADGGNYDAIASNLVDYIWSHEEENDKSRKLWPNPNVPDNYRGSSSGTLFNYNTGYGAPGFLFMTQ